MPAIQVVRERVPSPLTEPVERPALPPRDAWTPRACYELLIQYDEALAIADDRLKAIGGRYGSSGAPAE